MPRYTNKEGIGIPGVTECLDQELRPQLERWKLRKAIEAYDQGYRKGRALELAIEAAEQEGVNAAEVGTWIHLCASNILTAQHPLPAKGKEKVTLLESLHRFLQEVGDFEVISVERPVFGSVPVDDRIAEYAGTPDAIVRHQGEVTLIDFKSSKYLHPNYAAQMAAYMRAWNQARPDLKITKPWLVQLAKSEEVGYHIKRLRANELRLGWIRFQSCLNLWYVNSGKWGVALDW